LVALSVVLAGCTQGFYKKWADKEVFGILKKKSAVVSGADDDVLQNITPPPPVDLATLTKQAETTDFLGERAFIEKGARVVTLPDALNFAVHRNRIYLGRKERVYLSALTLTETRQQFGPIVGGAGASTIRETQVHNRVNDFVRTSSLNTDGILGLDLLMKTGARLAMDLTTDFTRFFTGGVRSVSDSRAAVALSQPLLRGAGVLVAAEPLRQWITAIRTYEEALDDLKIVLGLPVTEKIMLDNNEMKKLEVIDPKGTVEQMIDTALITRLDLFNQRDRVYDNERQVKIAHQSTLPTVNALAGYNIGTPTGGSTTGIGVNHRQRQTFAGLDFDLNLNTLPERNDLRAAQISEQAARRTLELVEEELRSTIRTDWRALQVARRQYDLAVKGLELSQKRLEGQGTARDIVESQDRLITARDLVISTLIDHNLARLQLWTDMGVLFIRKDARWADVLKQEKPQGDS
jgi:predicted RNase H-like HicB family nuclease